MPVEGLDDAAADGVVADERKRADRDLRAELVGHRGEDARLRETVDARNELDAALHVVQRRVDELGSSVPVHEKARAEMLVGDAQEALKQQEPLERLRSLTGELRQIAQSLSVAASTGAGASGGPTGSAAGANEPGADDDVIDADFSEG